MTPASHRRVLAVDPTSRGFGFVVIETPSRLVDWGVAHLRAGEFERSLLRIAGLLRLYKPNTLVIEDCASGGSRRCPRVRALLDAIAGLAAESHLRCERLSPNVVRDSLGGGLHVTKYGVAKLIVASYPELRPRLPPPRKPWMSEDERMGIFDAAALALTFLAR